MLCLNFHIKFVYACKLLLLMLIVSYAYLKFPFAMYICNREVAPTCQLVNQLVYIRASITVMMSICQRIIQCRVQLQSQLSTVVHGKFLRVLRIKKYFTLYYSMLNSLCCMNTGMVPVSGTDMGMGQKNFEKTGVRVYIYIYHKFYKIKTKISHHK